MTLRRRSLFFPQPPRQFRGQRWVRIGVRTWHLMSMAFLVGAAGLGQPPAEQPMAFWMTLCSGLLFVGLELYESCIWLFQLKGWAVCVKLLLFGAAAFSAYPLHYLLAAVVIGGISSHMPGRYRYYSLWHGRVVKQ